MAFRPAFGENIPTMHTRRGAWGVAAVAAIASAVAAGRSPSLRASFSAAYRAFRDPALLDPPPPPPPATVNCSRLGDESRTVDAEFRPSVDRPSPEDLDDPEGVTIATLTMPDVHVPITRRTMRYVRFFTKSDAGRTAFLQRWRRAGLYRESIAHALREAGLPEDLLWLAAVESGFDPRAVSPAGAAGLWQFMPETGQLYGLYQSPWVDERRSLTRSTTAAVAHLRDLYERFGRWDLALAAYNAGYDRVIRAMEKVAASRGPTHLDDRPIDFGDLCAARALPEETVNYVPQILAFALVGANRSRFGLDLPELTTPLEIGEIAVPEGTRLRTIARAAGVSIGLLREYNPQLLRDRIPPTGGDYLIALPENRVQRALASFPVYLDQEVVAQNEPDDGSPDDPVIPATEGFTIDPSADDPLPRRPIPLGKNRLPELAIPGHERVIVSASGFGIGILQAKLPAALSVPDIGWRQAFTEDPLGMLRGDHRGGTVAAKGREAAIDKQLGFLGELGKPVETLRSFSLPSGITVRVRRDKGAPMTAITVRIATVDESPTGASFGRPGRRGAEAGVAEAVHTITVDKADADAGIELGATRLKLLLGDTSAAQLAEIRFRAGAERRKALLRTPYGPAWVAMSEALFPADHPLAGTMLGAGEDGAALRDMMVAEAMRREHALARASLTVVGDVDELRAKKLAEAFLGAVSPPADAPVGPHPRDDRLTVEDSVTSPRALVGWVGPAEGEVGDASLRVAIELLQNPKFARLNRALVETGVASMAHAGLEIGPRLSVAAIELAPAPPHDLAAVMRRLEAELASLGTEGPGGNEVAVAKFLLLARVQKEMAAASADPLAGAVHSAGLSKLRHALRPWAGDRARKALEEVTPASVRAVVHRVFTTEHRVVVTTVPRR
jgi:hypothetical protein